MKYVLLIGFIVIYNFVFFGQKDSLLNAIKTTSYKDSAECLRKLAIEYRNENIDSSFYYAKLAYNSAFKTKNIKEQGNALNAIGVYYIFTTKYNDAFKNFTKALTLFEQIQYYRGLGSVNQNIGMIYSYQKRSELTLKYYFISKKYYEKAGYKKGVASILNNVATIYSENKDDFHSLAFHYQALEIRKEIQDYLGEADSYGNIAVVFNNLKQYSKSLEFNYKKLNLLKDNNNDWTLCITYNNIGDNYLSLGNFPKAKEYLFKGLTSAQKSKNLPCLNDIYTNLVVLYKKEKQFEQAIYYLEGIRTLSDSLYNVESTNKIIEVETKYQTEKKELQIKNQSNEISAQEKQNKQQQLIIVLGALALLSIGFFGAMAFVNFKKTQKAKLIIEEKNKLVETQNKQINLQKNIVEEKQKEIIDSINYAKRIQNAVLTGNEVWSKISVEHFILFKPKDIVSGDFYWAYNTPNNRSIFLLADCTGHGVPGGFMSMLGNSFLNEIIVENKIFKADTILNKLRDKIKTALHQDGAIEQKDGMDISLCVWNKLDNTLEFAGANNPMWLVRNNQITEYKADKMPIGSYVTDTIPFTAQAIQLQTGDCIYLITDGYADQFGGIKGKKYKYKPLMDLLLANHTKPMLTQKELFAKTIDDWKQGYEQVDDISLIGVRV